MADDRETTVDVIYGFQPVMAMLEERGGYYRELILYRGRQKGVAELTKAARAAGVRIRYRDKKNLDKLAKTSNHQGIVLIMDPAPVISLDDLLGRIAAKGQGAATSSTPPLLVIADGFQDPRNLGSLIRSAWCAGADGLVIPKDRAVGLTPVVAKAAAGVFGKMPVARVTNMARCLTRIKQAGLWVVGLDMKGEVTLYEVDLDYPVALVIGGEDKGLRPRIASECDVIARLPMAEGAHSLNAAVSGAVALFEVSRQRLRST